LELCTLHLEPTEDIDDIIATSVFADGAAAVVVKAGPPAAGGMRIEGLASVIAPDSEDDMAWTIGDTGFDMVLSTGVPNVLREHIADAVDDHLSGLGLSRADIETWAIHPGGRSILDRVSEALDLSADALDDAREVLRAYGNMSSPTILFVLERILYGGNHADSAQNDGSDDGGRIFAAAFGPGLTVETGVFSTAG
ncbi:MAG: type III polyketide synthase, partial [Rhodothermales bacterium]|nr:type III polyketide synthase [Rhodothermales bacterium]